MFSSSTGYIKETNELIRHHLVIYHRTFTNLRDESPANIPGHYRETWKYKKHASKQTNKQKYKRKLFRHTQYFLQLQSNFLFREKTFTLEDVIHYILDILI